MTDWILQYDGSLFLQMPIKDIDPFCISAFYKLSLKRYVENIYGDNIRFKSTLTYLDYKRVIQLCEREASKRGISLSIENELLDYISAKDIRLESRFRLGVELKNQDEKLQEKFDEYRYIVDNAMSRKLREKQMWDSFFMCAMRKSGNFSVPGSGKTASVLGMFAYLKAKRLIRRIVVVCPKNAFGSWIDEFRICFDEIEPLYCFNIHSASYKSTADRKRGIRLESGACNLLLFNFEALATYKEEINTLIDEHTLLVFDEVHKVKRIGGIYAECAVDIAKNAHYTVAMTGTPIPNSYTDIYNFLHILFPDEYEEFFNFNPALLRNPLPTDIASINNKMQPFFCRTTKKQLDVPDANPDDIISVAADKTENRILHILKMRYRNSRLALVIRILQLESNPHMLLRALDMNDFRYLLDDSLDVEDIDITDCGDEVKELLESYAETTKFRKCIDLTKDLTNQNKPVIIWCIFINSIERLSAELERQGIMTKCIYGEVALEDRQQILADFKAGNFQVLLTNPHTLAESVSLHSVCHDALYFEYSYNLVHLLQSKDRIHRLGLSEDQYTQYYFLQTGYETEDGEWSMDGAIYERLVEKERIMLKAIDSNMLEAMPTDEEDLAAIFGSLFK